MKIYEILSVDDDPSILAVISSALEDRGYQVTTATGGRAGIDALRMKRFDLVITDMNMPGADGSAVLKNARALQPHCGVIIVSGNPASEVAASAMQLGADDHMTKPFCLKELWTRVNGCLKKKALEQGREDRQGEPFRGSNRSANEDPGFFSKDFREEPSFAL